MFSDSVVAKAFLCEKPKCSYFVSSDTVPYFIESLRTQLMELEHFAGLLDKSYNKVEKQGQMSLRIRFLG